MAFRPPPPGGRRRRAPLHNRRILAKWSDRRDREEGPAGCPHRSKTRLPWVYGSVIEVEFVLLGNRIPVLVPFLEDGVEEGADDLPELLNLRPEARQLLHHFLVGRGHSQPLTAAITG